ncbi:E3 ubiquitin-protein ligase RNF123 isoform X3 [Vanacampus margaritifer]
MSSKGGGGGGTVLSRRNYRLASDTDKPKSTGVVNERLLSDYLRRVFPSANRLTLPASLRKPLAFQDLDAHLQTLLSEGETADDGPDGEVEGRLGPQPVVLDHTGGFEGLLFVDDDLLGVIGHSNFSSIRATTCVYKGKWAYEVLISSQGLMQIGWCTLNCRFNQEEGVGDTPDSYAYDGNRVRKWNVVTTNYGKSWAAGDIVSCLIDLDDATITFCLNGQSLGTAFGDIKTGPGVAYFPAISLSFKESVAFNFGSRPLRYPSEGYLPLQDPPAADLLKAHRLLGFVKNVLSTRIDVQEERVLEADCSSWRLDGEATVLIALAHIFNHFAPLMCKVYLVEDVLMNFLLGILEGGGSVDEHPLIQQLLDLFWLLMEDYEVNECLKQLMMSLLRAYRFSPIIPDLGFQIHYLRLTTAILRHEKSRKYLLTNVLFDVLRSVVFFYIKTPLRVKEAGLEELIPTTWWPTHFDKEGKDEREPKDESSDERLRRRAYERGCQRLKKRIEVVEELQVQILRLLLNNKDKSTGEASRYIFLNKFRKFLQENASNRGHPTALCPPEYMLCFLHRLIAAVRACWDENCKKIPGGAGSDAAYVPPQLFYNGKVDYFDLQRLGGLLSHLKKTLKDDLASKANVIIDPAEIQAASMDDLDEDDESGAAQMVVVADDVQEYAAALKDTDEKIARCPPRVSGTPVAPRDLFLPSPFAACLPPQRSDILEELHKSRKVFAEKLNHLSRRLAWINATIYSKEKMLDVYWLVRVCIGTIEHADRTGSLFAFAPEFYLNVAMYAYNALKNYFSPASSMDQLPGYEETLTQMATILAKHFADPRIVGTDIKDALMQALASYVCYPQSLRAVERIPEDQRVAMMKNLLAPYEQRPWAQTNWILVRLWRGCGFGYRYTRLPHLLKTKPEDANLPSLQKPCPSLLLQRDMARLLSADKDMAASFLNSVLNQLNWAFSEFIGMIQEIQQAAERPERNFVDTRQLKVCATCFDLSVSLLRVLEMTVTLVPEIFLDWSRPSAELLLRRLAQLLNQVLNRVTAEKNLFDRVVNLRLPGLESVDHYPILVAVTGILVRLLVDGDRNGTCRAACVLLSDPCFQLHSIQHLLSEAADQSGPRAAPTTTAHISSSSAATPAPSVAPPLPAGPSERRHFSLNAYSDYISVEEKLKVENMLAFLARESQQAATSAQPASEDDLCPICYAHPISAVFQPCSHKSCKACINQHLMNNKDCFFCKATITAVDDYCKPPAASSS